MLLLIQTLGALGGLLVLIAGIVGAKPFCGLKINPGDNLSTAQITGVVGALKAYLTWSLLLFAAGGACVFAAFVIYIAIS
ncbi:MAG: hypothetical protein AABY49_04150 [Planctomycetota bacterium]